MPERTHPRRQWARPERPGPINDPDRIRVENAALVGRIAQLSKALEGLIHDNAELRRTMARVQLENRDVKVALYTPVTRSNRAAQVRSMLRDPASRNP